LELLLDLEAKFKKNDRSCLIKFNRVYLIMYKSILGYLRSHFWELIRFLFVGCIALCINLGCFGFFYHFENIEYKVAVTIAYIITLIVYYLLHRIFTFRAENQDLKLHAWKFLLLLVLNYLINLAIVWFITDVIKNSPYIGIIVAALVTASVSFLTMRHFVFKFSD